MCFSTFYLVFSLVWFIKEFLLIQFSPINLFQLNFYSFPCFIPFFLALSLFFLFSFSSYPVHTYTNSQQLFSFFLTKVCRLLSVGISSRSQEDFLWIMFRMFSCVFVFLCSCVGKGTPYPSTSINRVSARNLGQVCNSKWTWCEGFLRVVRFPSS